MRYTTARYKDYQRELAYRIYVTDALKVIGGLNARYFDVIDDTPPDDKTPEEVIGRIGGKLAALGGG